MITLLYINLCHCYLLCSGKGIKTTTLNLSSLFSYSKQHMCDNYTSFYVDFKLKKKNKTTNVGYK
jgi:hypothetical protein